MKAAGWILIALLWGSLGLKLNFIPHNFDGNTPVVALIFNIVDAVIIFPSRAIVNITLSLGVRGADILYKVSSIIWTASISAVIYFIFSKVRKI